MAEAGRSFPEPTAMKALVFQSPEDATQIRKFFMQGNQGKHLDLANVNASDTLVLSGKTKEIDRFVDMIKRGLIKRVRVRPLNVSAPFHSRYMLKASEKFRAELEQISLDSALSTKAISNVLARPVMVILLLPKSLIAIVSK